MLLKNKIISLLTIFGIVLFISSIPITYAQKNVKENRSVKVNLSLDDSMVDYPIPQVMKMHFALEFTGDMYLINHIQDDNEIKIQVINEEEAYELGFVDDILEKIPEDVEVSFEILSNKKPVVALEQKDYQYRYKQVISEKETEKLIKIIEEKEQLNELRIKENSITNNKLLKKIAIQTETSKIENGKSIDLEKVNIEDEDSIELIEQSENTKVIDVIEIDQDSEGNKIIFFWFLPILIVLAFAVRMYFKKTKRSV